MNKLTRSSPTCETGFRQWLELLRAVRGHRPLWPVALGAALDAEFQRQVESCDSYVGPVFIDRDNHALEEGEREERQVAKLYRLALANDGCVALENERFWLLGYQWPTQGGVAEKGRRADLVGINSDGNLVVFEAKAAVGNVPLIAIMEGLDYLACLLRPANFDKILERFDAWKGKKGKSIPVGFEQTVPCRTGRATLVVLAPEKYFTGTHSRIIRSRDWPALAEIGKTMMKSVRLIFASTDFKSATLGNPTQIKK